MARSLAIVEHLTAVDPDSDVWPFEFAIRKREYEAFLAGTEADEDPDYGEADRQFWRARNRIEEGDILLAGRDKDGALENYRAALDITQRLAAQDAVWRSQVRVAHVKIAKLQRARGDLASALDHYSAALAIAERLAARDAAWQSVVRDSHEPMYGIVHYGTLLHPNSDYVGRCCNEQRTESNRQNDPKSPGP